MLHSNDSFSGCRSCNPGIRLPYDYFFARRSNQVGTPQGVRRGSGNRGCRNRSRGLRLYCPIVLQQHCGLIKVVLSVLLLGGRVTRCSTFLLTRGSHSAIGQICKLSLGSALALGASYCGSCACTTIPSGSITANLKLALCVHLG